MRRLLLFALAALVLNLAAPRPADAQAAFIRWLERLSGPGPFYGAGFEVYPVCFNATDQAWTVLDMDCGGTVRGERSLRIERVLFGVQYSKLRGNNELLYDPAIPADQTDSVGATIFLGSADVGFIRALDVGASVGFIRFSGMPSEAFSRTIFEPLRITFKPLAMKASSVRRDEWLQIRLVTTVLPGGFDAEDFGAIPGSYSSGTEVQANLYFIVDLGSFFNRQ